MLNRILVLVFGVPILAVAMIGAVSSPPPPSDFYSVQGPHTETVNGVAYTGGGYRIRSGGTTLLLAAKEDGADFYDIVSSAGDVDLFASDGSFVDCGPFWGARMESFAAAGAQVIAHNGKAQIESNGDVVLVKSTVSDVLLTPADGKRVIVAAASFLNLPVISSTPSAKSEGDVWMLEAAPATHQLQWYAGGATYQVSGTVVP